MEGIAMQKQMKRVHVSVEKVLGALSGDIRSIRHLRSECCTPTGLAELREQSLGPDCESLLGSCSVTLCSVLDPSEPFSIKWRS